MDGSSTTSSRRSLYRTLRDKLSRPKPLPLEIVSCERCRKVDHIVRLELNWNSRLHKAPDVFADSLQFQLDLDAPPACSFCQLLSSTFQLTHGPCQQSKQNVLVYFVDLAHKHTPKPGSWGIAVVKDNIVPPIKRRPINYSYAPLRREYRRQLGLILPVADVKVPDALGRLACLIQPSVNYTTLRRWLKKCGDGHPRCSVMPREYVYGMTVIDCESYQIVPLMPEQQYCALSYISEVADAVTETVDIKGDNNSWPRTFRDAAHVVLSLGYRYLWIDRYCIPDRHPEIRKLHMSMLDRIYGAAELTIAAASGTDCRHGLSGAGTLPILSRARQEHALLNSTHYVLATPSVDSILKTEWAKRAASYQHAILSRRCLVFTNEQVYLVCQTDYLAEVMSSTPQLTASPECIITLQKLFYDASPERLLRRESSRERTSLDAFEHHVRLFNALTLADEEDPLDEFRGILARSGYWTYWATPCIPTQGAQHPERATKPGDESIPIFSENAHFTLGVLRGLAWYVDRSRETRKCDGIRSTVPSWSLLHRVDNRIRFLCDPEHAASAYNPCFFGISDEIEVSVSQHKADQSLYPEDRWLPLSAIWQGMKQPTRFVPEHGRLLRLIAPVAEVVQVVINGKCGLGKEVERSTLIGYNSKSQGDVRYLIALMDDDEVLSSVIESVSQQVVTDTDWRLVRISSWTHCSYEDTSGPVQSEIIAAYLIVAPKGPFWSRKGIAVTPGLGSRAIDGQPVATTTLTPNHSLPAQTTSRVPSLNDDGFETMSIILT